MRSILLGAALAIAAVAAAPARDDGRYANSPLKSWFEQLASGKGLCCSFADGVSVQDVDWDTADVCEKQPPGFPDICDQHYRVRLGGEWVVVPHTAEVHDPNLFGAAVVWPFMDANGNTQIRCFMAGAGS